MLEDRCLFRRLRIPPPGGGARKMFEKRGHPIGRFVLFGGDGAAFFPSYDDVTFEC